MSKLYFRYGAMGCGKSSSILQVIHNYEEKGMKAILVKPAVDTKGGDKVVSRIGIERKVDVLLSRGKSLIPYVEEHKDLSAIIVDEAQFLEEKQVDDLYYITKMYDIPVLCYGLRCDFLMNGFEGAPRLLLIADTIEEIKSICECGVKATQNLRLVNGVPTFEGDQIAIDGENDVSYIGVCGKCYITMRNNKQKDENIV